MTTVSKEEIAANPDRYQRCSNGVVQDRETGRFVNAADNEAVITPTSSQRLVERGQEIWQENFNDGIARDHAGRQELAIQAIGTNLTKIATTTVQMPAVKAAAEVARLGGWVEQNRGSAPGTVVNVLNVADGRGLADIVDIIRDIDREE